MPDGEIKPCPFCGKAPRVERYRGITSVACMTEACFVVEDCSSPEDPSVIELWNTRAQGTYIEGLKAARAAIVENGALDALYDIDELIAKAEKK